MEKKSASQGKSRSDPKKGPDGSVILPDAGGTPVRDVRDAPSGEPQKSEHEANSTAVRTRKPTPDHKLRRSHL